jgi:hypothetical protein
MKTACIFLWSAALLSASKGPPIEPESGYNVQLPAGSGRTIALAVAGQKFVPKEEPVVVEATFGNTPDEMLRDAFHANWDRARPAAGRSTSPCRALAVVIAIDDSIQRTGTYNVVINLQPLSQPEAARWHLQIVQPAAQLDAQPLSITRLRFAPESFQEPRPRLVVREGSSNVDLTLTEVTQWDTTLGKGHIEILGVRNANASPNKPRAATFPKISAGGSSGDMEYRLAAFPPGKVTHTLRFLAPQLAAPAIVNVDVETRWPWFYLWLAIVAGLWASWYVKSKLKDFIDLQQAKLQADELLNQVNSARTRIHDGPFRLKLDGPRQRLEEARNQNVMEQIRSRHDELADALKKATAEHVLDMQTYQKLRDQLRAVLVPDWELPQDAVAAIVVAKNALAGVDDRFREFDVDGARIAITGITNALAARIQANYDHWGTVVQTVNLLSSAMAGLPARVVSQTAEALRTAPQGWQQIRHLGDAPDSDALSAVLLDYEGKLAFVNDLLRSLVLRLELEWEQVTNLLNPVRAVFPDPQAFQTLENNWNGLQAILRAGAQPDLAGIEITGDRVRQLQESWSQFFARQLSTADPALTILVANRQFSEAAAQLAFVLPRQVAAANAGRVLGNVPNQAAAPAAVGQINWATIASAAKARLGLVPGFAFVGSGLPYVKPFLSPPAEAIKAAQRVQTFILGLALTFSLLAGITSNGGSWADLFAAFTLAFAADTTVDAVLTRLRPKS